MKTNIAVVFLVLGLLCVAFAEVNRLSPNSVPCKVPTFVKILPISYRRQLKRIWAGVPMNADCGPQLASTRELVNNLPNHLKLKITEFSALEDQFRANFFMELLPEEKAEFGEILKNISMTAMEKTEKLREWGRDRLSVAAFENFEEYLNVFLERDRRFQQKLEKLSSEARKAYDRIQEIRKEKQLILSRLSEKAKKELASLYRGECSSHRPYSSRIQWDPVGAKKQEEKDMENLELPCLAFFISTFSKMRSSIFFTTVLFLASDAFVVKPQGVSGGTGNSWIYFGRGLNQKEIIDIAASKPNPEDEVKTTAAPVETTLEIKVESTAAPKISTTVEVVEVVEAEITTVAPEVLPLEKILSTALPETTVDARGIPETVAETTENPRPKATSESLPKSTLAPVENSTPEVLKKEIKGFETTASPTEAPRKIKIVVIPKEVTSKPETPVPEEKSKPEVPEEKPQPEIPVPEDKLKPEIPVPEETSKPKVAVPGEKPKPETSIPEEKPEPKVPAPEEKPEPKVPAPEEKPKPEVSVPEETSKPEPSVPIEASKKKSKPEESSSSSEETHYLKPDLHSMLRRIYRGNGPLHHP
ncbi:hypothetical protein FO519_001551 [Halicephalobus sp. NKZ332]|nr:hypothetical protein FO519_001551 [Halicephalobus sp. NKZ332]